MAGIGRCGMPNLGDYWSDHIPGSPGTDKSLIQHKPSYFQFYNAQSVAPPLPVPIITVPYEYDWVMFNLQVSPGGNPVFGQPGDTVLSLDAVWVGGINTNTPYSNATSSVGNIANTANLVIFPLIRKFYTGFGEDGAAAGISIFFCHGNRQFSVPNSNTFFAFPFMPMGIQIQPSANGQFPLLTLQGLAGND